MTSTNGRKRAILYTRVSTEEQARSGYSLAQQLEALREYAAREGYEVLEEISDPGQSGASLERPGMDLVRDLVAAGGESSQSLLRACQQCCRHRFRSRLRGLMVCKVRLQLAAEHVGIPRLFMAMIDLTHHG
jgi:predicted site-specific integrase-resolvase